MRTGVHTREQSQTFTHAHIPVCRALDDVAVSAWLATSQEVRHGDSKKAKLSFQSTKYTTI